MIEYTIYMEYMDKDAIQSRVLETLRAEEDAVSRIHDSLNEDFYDALGLIIERKGKILVTGVGKSGFIGMKMVATLISLGHEATFINPLDAMHGDSGIVKEHDVLLAFSFSGSSPELVRLVKHLQKHFSIKVISITGNRDSTLSKISDGKIVFSVEHEGCPLGLAPMASTTASLVIADSIASALTSPEIFKHEHFAKFHPAGSLGLSLKKVSEVMAVGDHLPTISEEALLNDALIEITLKKRGIVGVIDEIGRLVGVITDGDLRRIIISHDEPKNKMVKMVMTREPKMVVKDDDLSYTLKLMEKHQITNIFVVDTNNILVGLVNVHDIVEDVIAWDS